MYSFKTYSGVVVVENGTQEGLTALMTIFFPFCFSFFTRMSLPDLESPMFISDHLVQQPQLQAAGKGGGVTLTSPALHLPLHVPLVPPV